MLTVGTAIFGVALLQQAAPPYLDYIDEARLLARATVASVACGQIGYGVVPNGMLREGRAFRRRAILDHTDGWVLDAAYSEELAAEEARFVEMLTPSMDGLTEAEQDAIIDQAAEFWERRCYEARLAYPDVFSLPVASD